MVTTLHIGCKTQQCTSHLNLSIQYCGCSKLNQYGISDILQEVLTSAIISSKLYCVCRTFLCKASNIPIQGDVKSVNLVGTSMFAELLQSLARYQLCQLPIIDNDAGVQYQFTAFGKNVTFLCKNPNKWNNWLKAI